MLRHLPLALGLLAAGSAGAATAYPFPYQADYPFGIRSPVVNAATIQSVYSVWKTDYYTENGDKARIMWADPAASGNCDPNTANCTVSEGIGYGMLITVFMDNSTNNTQPMFDKLWNYYSSNTDGKGLMNWKINGFNGTVASGAATDADLDVALALCMAYKQWGTQKYKDNAISVLGKIWSSEVGSNVFLPDDQGTGNLFNPSYFAVGAARVFAQVDASHNWGSVADGCLSKLASIQAKYSTGLVPDWVDGGNNALDHNGSGNNKFGYDAVRTPWRVGLDYLWFGNANSKTFLSKIATWIKGATANPAGIKMDYKLDGTYTGNNTNAVYLGAFTIPVTVNETDTLWIRMGATRMANSIGTDHMSYYNDCWRLLYLLTLSGNFQNLWGTVKSAGVEARQGLVTWSARMQAGSIRLQGTGAVEARLLDMSGRVLSQASGEGALTLARPSGSGVYFVRISGAENGTFPVVAR